MATIKWLHCRPNPPSYPISSRSRGSNYTTMIPGEQQVWKPPVANCGLLCSFKHSVVRTSSSGVGALPSSIHRVCVTTRLRTTRGCMPPRSSLRGLASESARLVVRWYVTFLLLWRRTRESKDRIKTRPICPDRSTKVDKWAVESGQLPMQEFTAAFRGHHSSSGNHRVYFSFTFSYIFVHFSKNWKMYKKLSPVLLPRFQTLRSHTHRLGKSPMHVMIDG